MPCSDGRGQHSERTLLYYPFCNKPIASQVFLGLPRLQFLIACGTASDKKNWTRILHTSGTATQP